jgi:hypothetical protein
MRTEFFTFLKSGVYLITSLIVLLAAVPGCNDDPDEIGANILPSSDDFSVSFDSTGLIEVTTHFGDSVRSNLKPFQLIGSYVHPFFGFSKAEIITQLEAPGIVPEFDPGDIVDSAFLNVYYEGHFGDDMAVHQVSIYEFTEKLQYDTSYYSSYNPDGKYLPEVIGTGSAYTNDSLIRIRITDMELLERLMSAEDTVYKDQDMFIDMIRGLYLRVEDQTDGGSILYTNLTDDLSVLKVYYRNDEDTLVFNFAMGWYNGIDINIFSHDYSGYPVEQYLNDGSDNDSLVFIQGMGGLNSYLRFPQLDSWRDSVALCGPIAINSADLVVIPESKPVGYLTEEEYPVGLNLYRINEDNRYDYVYDYLMDETSFGGGYNEDDNEYRFSIKSQIQSYINGDIANNEPFLISAGNTANSLSYVILRGASHSSSARIRLEIVYTKF